jgi:uncharacterized membrane protein YbhN (UPF0104 family)
LTTSSIEPPPGGPKRGLKAILSWVVVGIFLVWAASYVRAHMDEFRVIGDISVAHVAILLTLAVLSFIVSGVLTRTLVRPFGAELGVFEAFSISLVSLVGNYIMPFRGGMGIRALYLKRRHGLPYGTFTRILAGRFVLVFLVESMIGLVNLWVLRQGSGRFHPVLLLILGTAFVFSTVVLVAPGRERAEGDGSRFRALVRSVTVTVRGNPSRGWLLVAAVANSAVRFGIILFAFRSIGTVLTPSEALLISTLIPFSMIVSVTPGNIGVTEGVFLFACRFLGVPAPAALIAATIVRASFLAWSALGVVFLRRWIREPGRRESGGGKPSRGAPPPSGSS